MENLLTIFAMLFVGCSGDPNCEAERAALSQSTQRTSPFVLEVSGDKEGTDLVLTVRVSLQGKVGVDPVLEIALPEGASLVSGKARETIKLEALTRPITRTFVVRGATTPVDVTVTAASRASGTSLTRSWPPRIPEKARVPDTRRIPPVKVHGVPIDEAIPIKPNQK